MSKGSPKRYYWDSCAFLAWLLPEEERKGECGEVIETAEQGECQLITSAITLTEVVKLKGLPPLKEEQEEKIARFFANDYILVIGVDRFIAEAARRLIWQEGVHPKDSIHLATALKWKDDGIREFHTYDGKLLGLDETLGTSPKLRIRRPAAEQRRISSVLATEPDQESESSA